MAEPTSHAACIARRCRVSGRVQGVFYRASAQQRAAIAGVSGYARNLSNGQVEVLVCGEPLAVAGFIEWLHVGPAAAKVSAVDVESVQLSDSEWPDRFTTA